MTTLVPRSLFSGDLVRVALAGLLAAAASSVLAQTTVTWTSAGDTAFATGANWDNGAPANDLTSHIARFSTADLANPELTASQSIAGLAMSTPTTFSATGGAILTVGGSNIAVSNTSSGVAISAPLAGTGRMIKTGAGSLTLSGANTYSGGTNLAAGSILNLANASALGSGTFTFDSGASATIDNTSGAAMTLSTNNSVTFNGDSIAFVGTHDLNLGGGTVTLGSGTKTVDVSANTLTMGAVTGAGGLRKYGSGTLLITGATSFGALRAEVGTVTLSGPSSRTALNTVTSTGTLNINHASALGTGTLTLAGSPKINNTSGAPITLTTNNAQNWNSNITFLGSNSLNLGTGAVKILANRLVTVNGSTLTVGGAISTGGGITKAGAGTLELAGANLYDGATAVNVGTLLVTGSLAADSTVTVNNGATLGGTGTINGNTTVASGGILAPGNRVGLLTFGAGLTLADGSITNFQINGSVRGTTFDAVNTAGPITYGGTLNLVFGTTIDGGTTLDLFELADGAGDVSFASITASGSYTGTFANDGSGVWTLADGPQTLTFTESTGDLTFDGVANDVPDAPTGADKTITINEAAAHTFSASDFGFSDVDSGDAISAVRIDSLPLAGALTLSGIEVTATQAIAAANLGNLVFTPAANAHGTTYATFTFSVADQTPNYAAAPSTIFMSVTAVNDAPVLSAGGTFSYTENASAIPLEESLLVSDLDDTQITSATVTISAGFTAGDILGFLPHSGSGITGSYNAGTGVLTFSGSSPIGNYQSILRSVTYSSSSDAPTAISSSRTLTWAVTDGNASWSGAETSSGVTSTINVTGVNGAPVLADTVLTFTSLAEDSPSPAGAVGQLVSDFTGGFSDADENGAGVAITGVNANGSLWYSTDNGTTWTRLTGTVSDASALMLYADGTTRIYFEPAANFNGTLDDAITFRAWDRTEVVNGATGVAVKPGLALVGSLATGNAAHVTVAGNHAYMSDQYFGLKILDITDPANPALTGSYTPSNSVNGMAVSGNYAYVANGTNGLVILNISNPASPTLVGTCDTAGTANSVTLSGNYAYVADDTNGLVLIDITNPASPTVAGSYDTAGQARYVVVSGSRAFVADDGAGLVILDVTNPASPTLLGSYNTPQRAFGVAVSGDHAYVADQTAGLLIFDVSDPTNPTLSGSYDTPGLAVGVTIVGDYAYVADSMDGLIVIDVGNPAAPTLVTTLDTAGNANAVTVAGNHAYVADGPSGLVVMSLPGIVGYVSTASDTVAITITGVNDAPTDITLSANSINESAGAGAIVGTLTTTDADATDVHTYSLVSGTGDTHNSSFTIDGATLKHGASAPVAGIYSIRIQTDDGHEGTYAEAFSITVVDTTAPTVSSVTVPANATYIAGQNLDFTVTYSENVTVNTTDGTPYIAVILATGGSVQAAYLGGTGTSALTFRYTIVAGNLDADGIEVASAITLDGGTIKDSTGNNAVTTSLDIPTTAAVLVDAAAPTVSSINREAPSDASTNATSVAYRVTFAKAVSGVDAGDFTVTKTGTADGAVASVNAVSETLYDVTVHTISGDGTLRLDLNNADTNIADLLGNAIATGFTGGETYTIDHTAPTVSSIVRHNDDDPVTVNTDAATITYRVTFDGGVAGVDAADFTLTAPAGNTPASTATGTVTTVIAQSATVYDVVVTAVSGQGKARLDLKSTGTGITDRAGNAIDGGFTTGEFYFVGATSVFDSLSLASHGAAPVDTNEPPNRTAQRFTVPAGQPVTLTSVVARVTSITATPTPVVQIYTNNAGTPGTAVGDAFTNPSGLTTAELNVWTGSVTLDPDPETETTYWIVFASSASAYEVDISMSTSGGSGAWLTGADYKFRWGGNLVSETSGALHLALGATSIPTITSTLTASGTYGSSFSYQITATNTPTSYAATNLPRGLSLNATSGLISGSPAQTGTFSNISLTATNGSTTAPTAAGSYSIGLDRRLQLFGLQLGDVHHLHDVRADLFAGADHQSRHHGRERDIEPLGVQCRAGHGGELRAVQGRCDV